ncbi:hybrid sensor histidine kinase/response regulator transcription factor [Pelagicoccus mobilis]|uniref:hybrid sensor histidine kinase/response regulator transcription factor n=1 Tax=Pelagicoccus mobilis TaxID=415221 RepID=UPI0036724EEF
MLLKALLVSAFANLLSTNGLSLETYEVEKAPSLKEEWRWTELEALEGVPYDFIREAADGVLWFGSRGGHLARYDGTSLERFDLPDPEGTPAVLEFHLSPEGKPLFLTPKKLLHLENGEWEALYENKKNYGSFHAMGTVEDGTIWFAAWKKLLRYKEGKVQSYDLGFDWVESVLIDSKGKLWLSSGNSYEVRVYDVVEDELELRHFFEPDGVERAKTLQMDYQGRIWVLDPSLDGVVYYYEDYEKKVAARNLKRLYKGAEELVNASGLRAAVLPSGRAWLGSRLVLAEVGGGRASYFQFDSRLPSTVPILHALSDERLVVGGRESKTYIVDLSENNWATYQGLNYQCEDQEGVRWFLAHDGRVVASPRSGPWVSYGPEDGMIARPNRILCSRDGTVWVSGANEGSAAVSYRVNGDWIREEFSNLSHAFSHLSAHELKDGSLFFGSGSTKAQLGGRSGGAISYRKDAGRWIAESLSTDDVPYRPAVSLERVEGDMWFGGRNIRWGGRDLGGAIGDLAEAQPDRWIDHIVSDGKGGLWMAVWGFGVCGYIDGEWVLYTTDDGLPSNQVIHLLKGETLEGIWAVTSEGISRYDGVTWTDWSFPFGKRFYREAVTLREGNDGALWINTSYRLWLLEGQKDEGSARAHNCYMYQPDLSPPETFVGELRTKLPEGSPLVVDWNGRDTWSATPSSGLEFSWRLGDGDWSGYSRDSSVVVEGISAGDHTIEVRARDWDWNVDPTPAQVSVRILPPIWRQAWFIGAVIFTFGLIAFLLYRLFQARVRAALAMEEFKLDFFTNISHELRNPLAVILGPLESLQRDEEDAGKRNRLGLAMRSARKMQGLVDQLLQFRKVELGKASFRPSAGELIGFLREVVELQAPLGKERNVSVSLDTSEDRLVCGYDADKLQKIVDNLVSNAIKYSPDGACVLVSVETAVHDGLQEVDLVVEDQGPGIPKHEIELISKPFYRVGASRDSQDGFGIGLALVSGLVKVWGGEIEFISPANEKGSGTRVRVSLPLEYAHDEEVEKLDTGDLEESEAESATSKAKILLVEDNHDLRGFVRDELSRDYEVFEAENGKIGIEMVAKIEPDLVVTDVMMPEMNGFELCKQLRADPATSHIQIIMLTAKSAEEHSVEGMEAGADVYFAKPLNMARLQAQIEKLVEMRRSMKLRFSEQLVVEPTELSIVPVEQEWLAKAIAYVEENMSDPDFDLDSFAREMGLGRTALYKKLKALTDESPGSFVRSMRLKRAAQLLRSESMPISKILEFIGILDQSYFSRAFKKKFGVSPSQYAKESRLELAD